MKPSETNNSPNNKEELYQLAQSIKTCPKPEPELHEILTHTPHAILACLPDEGQTDILDQPDLDSLLYFHVLMSRLETCMDKVDIQKTLSHAYTFCMTCDRKQLKLIASKDSPSLYLFASYLSQCSSQTGQLQSAIEPLANLIKSYGDIHILTPLHNELLKISLQSRSIEWAIQLTNLDIDIDQEEYPIRYQDHLLYHYLAGTVQALNRNYQRAKHLFTIAVSAPGPGISQIQVEAYKKLIFVSLLWNSLPPTLPPYTNPHFKLAFRNVNSHKMYLEFMNLYESAENSSEGYVQLVKMAEKNMNNFQKDSNHVLVQLCIESLPKKAIKKLIPIYEKIPISRIDKMLGDITKGNARRLIESMISGKELNAELDEDTNVIKFCETEEQGKSHQDVHEIQQQEIILRQTVERVQKNEKSIQEISQRISQDKEFLKRLVIDLKLSSSSSSSSSSSHHNNNNMDNKLLSSTNEILQSVANTVIDKNFNRIIDENLSLNLSLAWE